MKKYLIIHHTAVSQRDQPIQLYAVNRHHKEKFNMLSSLGWHIGYNYFIDSDGTLTQCRKEDEETAAVIGHNFDSIHICLAGNFDIEIPNQKQLNTLKPLLDTHTELELKLHRDLWLNTACPGRLLTLKWLEEAYKPKIAPLTVDEKKAEAIKEKAQPLIDGIKKLFDQLLALLK